MKLLILSDLHLEGGAALELPPDLHFDVSVIAGDIHSPGREAVMWAKGTSGICDRPAVMIAGNHEYYGAPDLNSEMAAMVRFAEGSHVHVLNRRAVVIGEVRFLGCTLWTDFQLPFVVDDQRTVNVEQALRAANARMADFREIQVIAPAIKVGRPREFLRLLRAEDTLAMHWTDRDWLRRELQKPFDGPTVVVTHHAPALESVATKYDGDQLTPAFVSPLPDELFEIPALWVHGHTHTSVDYMKGGCRVVSNPRGYTLRRGGFENLLFVPGLVIDLALPQKRLST